MTVAAHVGLVAESERLFQREILRALIDANILPLTEAQSVCLRLAETLREGHQTPPHRDIADMIARQFEDVASHLAGSGSLPRD